MISREDRGPVAVLRLGYGKANALDLRILQDLAAEIGGLPEATRALILTGNDRMFSAGLDLPTLLESGPEYTFELIEALNLVLEGFLDLSIPSVAAMNGHAIAGGYILACACDVRLMVSGSGKVGLTEHLLGVPFPPLALEVVRSAIGDQTARRVALHAELFSADEAEELGMVDEVVAPNALMDRAMEIADRLGAIPRATFELTKSQLMVPLRERLERLGDPHEQSARRVWVAEETRRTIRGFVRERLD